MAKFIISKNYSTIIICLMIFISCKRMDLYCEDCGCPACPTIDSIIPNHGLPGDMILLLGNNFSLDNKRNIVKIKGIPINENYIVNSTLNSIVFKIPDDFSGCGPVTINVKDGLEPLSGVRERWLTTDKIIVNSFSPLSAKKDSIVTIYGKYFDSSIKVSINGIFAKCIYESDSLIKFYVPKGCGNGKIKLECCGNTVESEISFTYKFTVSASTIKLSGPILSAGFGLTLDKDNNNLYIVDNNKAQIIKVQIPLNLTPNSTINANSSVYAGTGISGFKDGALSTAQFKFPHDIKINDNGDFYISDDMVYGIRKIDFAKNTIKLISGSSIKNGYSDGICGTNFGGQVNLAVYKNNVYIIEHSAQFGMEQLRVVENIETNCNLTTLDQNLGYALACDLNGAVYSVSANCITKIVFTRSSDGKLFSVNRTIVAGKIGSNGYANGTLLEAQFGLDIPSMQIGPDNKLYVVDRLNNSIRVVDFINNTVTSINESTIPNPPGSNSPILFNSPRGICFDNFGNLYVTDDDGKTLRKIFIE